jgi:hypothetical protein
MSFGVFLHDNAKDKFGAPNMAAAAAASEFRFTFGGTEYTARATYQGDTLLIGSDDYACITISRLGKHEYEITMLQTYQEDIEKELACFDPPVPRAGALDLLVTLAIAIIDQNTRRPATIRLTDEAKKGGLDLPLSFAKLARGDMPTYYKYGFLPDGVTAKEYRAWARAFRRDVLEDPEISREIRARYYSKFSFGKMHPVLEYLKEIGHPFEDELVLSRSRWAAYDGPKARLLEPS